MKDYIEGMRALRDSLDKVWDELTDTLKHKFGGLEDTEVYLMKAQIDLTEKYMDVLDARISHATLKEQIKEDEK
uniref:crAss001_48 related protein n=1 Tax=Megasphaera elsdenii TaxID=907 RepID=UPI003FEF1844